MIDVWLLIAVEVDSIGLLNSVFAEIEIVTLAIVAKSTPAIENMSSHSGPEQELPPLGFIAIELDIHRPCGDPYNEQTWPFPLIRETAEGSKVSQVVTSEQYDSAFIGRFVDAGLRLAERGCVGIITSCGFLAMAQAE